MKYRHRILARWLKGPAMPLSVPRVGLLCILVLCGAASTAMADDRPEGRVEELASAPPSTLEKSYDLVLLRPFGLFQVATGSVILVAAYLPALAFDGEDDAPRLAAHLRQLRIRSRQEPGRRAHPPAALPDRVLIRDGLGTGH